MLYISDEDVLAKLESPNNVIEKRIRDQGKRPGTLNKTPEFRAVAGSLARIIGGKAVSDILDVSAASANNYANGKIAPVHGVNQDLKNEVDKRVGKVSDIALDKLVESLSAIDTSKLDSPKTASSVAKDLASVIEKTSAKDHSPTNVNVHIYVPEKSHLDDYDTIEINPIK